MPSAPRPMRLSLRFALVVDFLNRGVFDHRGLIFKAEWGQEDANPGRVRPFVLSVLFHK